MNHDPRCAFECVCAYPDPEPVCAHPDPGVEMIYGDIAYMRCESCGVRWTTFATKIIRGQVAA